MRTSGSLIFEFVLEIFSICWFVFLQLLCDGLYFILLYFILLCHDVPLRNLFFSDGCRWEETGKKWKEQSEGKL